MFKVMAEFGVHPLYTEQWPIGFPGSVDDLEYAQAKLRSTFLRTTNSVYKNPASSPLFVYEAIKKLDETKSIIATHLNSDVSELGRHGIVFLPTEADSSSLDDGYLMDAFLGGNEKDRALVKDLIAYREAVREYVDCMEKQQEEINERFPGYSDSSTSQPLTDRENDEYFLFSKKHEAEIQPIREKYLKTRNVNKDIEKNFTKILYNKLGLQSAIVSGAYLTGGENLKTKEPELTACAGSVAQMLRDNNIPTDISQNIWPSKDRLKKLGFEIKQTGRGN